MPPGQMYRVDDGCPGALAGEAVAVLGYGHLGRSAALNLRDSGVKVRIGNRATRMPTRPRRGFEVVPIAVAAGDDIVWVLLPDEVIPDVFATEVAPALRPGRRHRLRLRVQPGLRPRATPGDGRRAPGGAAHGGHGGARALPGGRGLLGLRRGGSGSQWPRAPAHARAGRRHRWTGRRRRDERGEGSRPRPLHRADGRAAPRHGHHGRLRGRPRGGHRARGPRARDVHVGRDGDGLPELPRDGLLPRRRGPRADGRCSAGSRARSSWTARRWPRASGASSRTSGAAPSPAGFRTRPAAATPCSAWPAP